jgi:hypothetical protein
VFSGNIDFQLAVQNSISSNLSLNKDVSVLNGLFFKLSLIIGDIVLSLFIFEDDAFIVSIEEEEEEDDPLEDVEIFHESCTVSFYASKLGEFILALVFSANKSEILSFVSFKDLSSSKSLKDLKDIKNEGGDKIRIKDLFKSYYSRLSAFIYKYKALITKITLFTIIIKYIRKFKLLRFI